MSLLVSVAVSLLLIFNVKGMVLSANCLMLGIVITIGEHKNRGG